MPIVVYYYGIYGMSILCFCICALKCLFLVLILSSLTEIISKNYIVSVTIVRREVPRCGGVVGAASAFAIMESGLFSEMVLIDANKEKAEGEALDISHGLPFAKPMKIYAGEYKDISDAYVIVVTVRSLPGAVRMFQEFQSMISVR